MDGSVFKLWQIKIEKRKEKEWNRKEILQGKKRKKLKEGREETDRQAGPGWKRRDPEKETNAR